MATIPPKLIFDPYAPIPAKMSKTDRARLQDLRDAYQASMRASLPKTQIRVPEQMAEFIAPFIVHHTVETLAVVGLNARSRVIDAPVIISRGDVDGTDAGPRPVLRAVLVMEATTFIVAHNHPTGEAEPSPADIAVTKRLITGGRAVDCDLVDHIILGRAGDGRYLVHSLRREHPELWSQS